MTLIRNDNMKTKPQTKPRFDPKQLPLVKAFKALKKRERDNDVTVTEARAIHRAVCRLDSIVEFALHILHRIKRRNAQANFDELYLEYVQFCVSKAQQPHSQSRFEGFMRLRRLTY